MNNIVYTIKIISYVGKYIFKKMREIERGYRKLKVC